MADAPRDALGRFVKRACPLPNCDGTLQQEDDGWWRCDGLTHEGPEGPLYACVHVHHPLYAPNTLTSYRASPGLDQPSANGK